MTTAEDIIRKALDGLGKQAQSVQPYPSHDDLKRMYDVVQADARLTRKLSGLGFGSTGDAYRKAAVKLRILELMQVLRDGKNIRNDIVHKPGYIPSEDSAKRALQEYAAAEGGVDRFLRTGLTPPKQPLNTPEKA